MIVCHIQAGMPVVMKGAEGFVVAVDLHTVPLRCLPAAYAIFDVLKTIHTKRFNTITQYLGRGTLDEQTAAVMKALAKSKLEKALQDSGYVQGGYAAEMEQAALLAEVKETMER